LACLLPACTVETTSPPRHRVVPIDEEGSVTLDWTIDGVKNPDSCMQSAVASIDVTVRTDAGDFVGEYQEACGAFATQIALPPGRYVASAVLIDAVGADRTTAVDVDPFRVVGGTDLVVPIDFPARSFE
jgi:hypothetical protein